MKTKMLFWTWRTKKVKALLEWMKQYNQDKPEADKLHYYGFDCQSTGLQPDLLLSYFNTTSPELHNRSRSLLTGLKTLSFSSTTISSYAAYRDSLASIQNFLDTHRDTFISSSSLKEWKINKQLVTTLQQTIHLIYAANLGENGHDLRDKYMADNVKWMSELNGQDSKISIWAHNFHIGNYNDVSAGFHLNNLYGASYPKIGFAFSTGSFTALADNANGSRFGIHTINEAPLETSVNWLFHHAKEKNFAFVFQTIPVESGWKKFIT
jgi:erythromycin esterase